MAASVRVGLAGAPLDELDRSTSSSFAVVSSFGDPLTSVTDKVGRTHDIDNLFVCDGSLFPTQGSANPGLTIQALAARTADYLIHQGEAIFSRGGRRSQEAFPIRYDMSPPDTWGSGVPSVVGAG